ncbi:universal stress protein [Azospirillum himalayense]|uniref:Universal stress protein n=1 Tax=Azospirillum himalayense TaxID=654847 RepID=A0ABW0GEB8_9PROT
MSFTNLLVHVDDSDRCGERLTVALTLAQKHGAALTGLFAQSDSSGAGIVTRKAGPALTQAAQRAREMFEEKAREAGVTTRWWQLSHGEYGHVIAETVICSRYVDLAVFGQHDPEDSRVPADLLEEVVLNAGRPILVVPHSGSYSQLADRPVIAWNGSREAARAVNDALPLLKQASSVLLLAFHTQPRAEGGGTVPQVDILEHLASHGVTATQERMTIASMTPMDAVLSRASDHGADLLVMGGFGGYGGSLFPLFGRGSNTRQILRQMTLPVLLSH